MSRRQYKLAYKRLKIKEYTNIIKDTAVPYFDDYDGEFITMLRPETKFTAVKHYHDDCFLGWNIYADGELLETKSSSKKAERFIRKIKKCQESP